MENITNEITNTDQLTLFDLGYEFYEGTPENVDWTADFYFEMTIEETTFDITFWISENKNVLMTSWANGEPCGLWKNEIIACNNFVKYLDTLVHEVSNEDDEEEDLL